MRIFQDGRTGSIRIISRPEGELARVSEEEHDAASDAAAPTRGGRTVTQGTPASQTPVAGPRVHPRFPDVDQ